VNARQELGSKVQETLITARKTDRHIFKNTQTSLSAFHKISKIDITYIVRRKSDREEMQTDEDVQQRNYYQYY